MPGVADRTEEAADAYTGVSAAELSPVSAAELSSAVALIGSFVSGFEPGRYTGEDAASLVTLFTKGERLCRAGKTLAAGRVAESNRHVASGHRTPAEWLAQQTGEPVGEAVDLLKLVDVLGHHQGMDEAYREGKLSRTGASLVAGALAVNPDAEDDLVKGVEQDTFRQLKARCLRAKAEARSKKDADQVAQAMHRARRCRTWTDDDGFFRLAAYLTPEAGARLCSSLDIETDRFFDQARRSGVEESPDQYRADALVALVTGQGILPPPPRKKRGADRHEVTGTDSVGESGDTAAEERMDSVSSRQGHRPPATVHLRVDLDALRNGRIGTGQICEIPGVGPVSLETARDLLGDALIDLVITNGVDVTTICRYGRSIPTPLRTAVIERDQCCVVPGCDVRQGLEIDHWQVDFALGGTVSLENLARLCHHHHYLRTHQGFTLSGGPGRWCWDLPSDPTRPRPRPRSRPRPRQGRRAPGSPGSPGGPGGPDRPDTTGGKRRFDDHDPPQFSMEE